MGYNLKVKVMQHLPLDAAGDDMNPEVSVGVAEVMLAD